MNRPKHHSSPKLHRVDGQLHHVHHIHDDDGNLVTTVSGPLKVEFRLEDFVQLAVGVCVMALPVALTEEVWDMADELSLK